ncbi:hypothetical protein MMC06_004562 [Schaereria dolodes]|nr:hypothetical protein [Schaereria dolodes]
MANMSISEFDSSPDSMWTTERPNFIDNTSASEQGKSVDDMSTNEKGSSIDNISTTGQDSSMVSDNLSPESTPSQLQSVYQQQQQQQQFQQQAGLARLYDDFASQIYFSQDPRYLPSVAINMDERHPHQFPAPRPLFLPMSLNKTPAGPPSAADYDNLVTMIITYRRTFKQDWSEIVAKLRTIGFPKITVDVVKAFYLEHQFDQDIEKFRPIQDKDDKSADSTKAKYKVDSLPPDPKKRLTKVKVASDTLARKTALLEEPLAT